MARSKQSKEDPTGQGANRLKAFRSVKRRLDNAQRQVVTLFRAIPNKRRAKTRLLNNEQTVFYDYDLTPEQREDLQAKIRAILDAELETFSNQVPNDWFFKPQIEPPYREGTLEELNNFNQLIAAAAILGMLGRLGLPPQKIPAELVLTSPAYLQALSDVYVTNYGNIKTLSNRTADQVIQRINSGVAGGQTPTRITNDIVDRFDVSRSNAKRIVVTEVNQAYTNAKLEATSLASEESGLRAGVVHISALLATTRETHAARHGNAYTVEDQRQWWDSGTNRINCHCSVSSVLIDGKGDVVQKELQAELLGEKMT